MPTWEDEQKQEERARAASFMLPWKQFAEILADHLEVDLDKIGYADDQMVLDVLAENGFTRETMVEGIPEFLLVPEEQRDALLDAIGFEKWMVENVRRGAREEDPLPFGLHAGGTWIDASHEDYKTVWAVATSMSDPDALAKTFVRNCKKAFGTQAFKDVSQHSPQGKEHPFTPEQMAAMHERGLSYKEIAIQSLRDEYPDIVADPDAYKTQIKREKERLIKVIRAAHGLWNLRMPEDSIG